MSLSSISTPITGESPREVDLDLDLDLGLTFEGPGSSSLSFEALTADLDLILGLNLHLRVRKDLHHCYQHRSTLPKEPVKLINKA